MRNLPSPQLRQLSIPEPGGYGRSIPIVMINMYLGIGMLRRISSERNRSLAPISLLQFLELKSNELHVYLTCIELEEELFALLSVSSD